MTYQSTLTRQGKCKLKSEKRRSSPCQLRRGPRKNYTVLEISKSSHYKEFYVNRLIHSSCCLLRREKSWQILPSRPTSKIVRQSRENHFDQFSRSGNLRKWYPHHLWAPLKKCWVFTALSYRVYLQSQVEFRYVYLFKHQSWGKPKRFASYQVSRPPILENLQTKSAGLDPATMSGFPSVQLSLLLQRLNLQCCYAVMRSNDGKAIHAERKKYIFE